MNSFEEFFVGYSSDDNQYTIITISHHNTHLFFGEIIELSSNMSYNLSEENLFREISDSDLLEFTCQKTYKLFNIKKI